MAVTHVLIKVPVDILSIGGVATLPSTKHPTNA